MMFPSDADFTIRAEPETVTAGKSFHFDYQTGKFVLSDGINQTINGAAAVEQWIELFLRTRPDVYGVYDGVNFGVDTRMLVNLRGLPEGFVRSEFERQVREGLTLNPHIDHAEGFSYTRKGRTMEIAFTVHLKTGEKLEVRKNA